jgi:hypothetical protein
MVKEEIDRLLEAGFIYPVNNSEWVSPIVVGFSGYNQVFIRMSDQLKTTFTTEWGTFAFNRMLFGLCNAPGTFQRLMMDIFKDF